MKQAFGHRRGEQTEYISGASALTKHGHVVCVTAKARYVVLRPSKCLNHIQRAKIGQSRSCQISAVQCRMDEPTQWTETIIDHHNNHALPRGKSRKVIGAFMARHITAAMNPQHNGEFAGGLHRTGRVDVEVKTVFASQILTFCHARRHTLRLRTHDRVCKRKDLRLGAFKRGGCSPTTPTYRGLCIGNVTINHRPLRSCLRGHDTG